VLVRVAEVLRHCLRETDLVGRIGGEEFVLLLPDTELGGVESVIERCRASIERSPVTLEDGSPLPVSASFGVVIYENGEEISANELISRADEMLYRAKAAGRNRAEFWSGGAVAAC